MFVLCVCTYVCIVHTVYENALLFSLEHYTRASQLYLGEGVASNSLAPAQDLSGVKTWYKPNQPATEIQHRDLNNNNHRQHGSADLL